MACCIVLALLGHGAQALTIGNVRGAVLIGKPVNVTVPITLDAGESPASACTEVDISFADARVDASRIRTNWIGESALRVQTTVAVDEPMINIWLRAGCTRKSERRFVLLADVVTESTTTGPVVIEAFTPSVPAVSESSSSTTNAPKVAETAASPVVVASGKVESKPAATKKPRTKETVTTAAVQPKVEPVKAVAEAKPIRALPVQVPPSDEASKPMATVAASKPAVAVAQADKPKDDTAAVKPRLRVEGLPDFNPGLKSSLALSAGPVEDLQARENARAIWKSLNATPDDLINISKRLAALEGEAKLLRDGKAKVQADQDALKSQLERAEDDRYSNWLVALLAALFLGASALAGVMWWRSREKAGWSPKDMWHGSDDGIEPSNLSDLAPVDSAMSGAMPLSTSGRTSRRRKAGAPDIDLGVDESLFDSLKGSGLPSVPSSSRMDSGSIGAGKGFINSMSARTVNVEELFDIQQQAEFFVSLGQHEQAIELLRQHIQANASTSGIAYLDLLKIYHDLDRRSEYEQLREEFNQSFNAKVPPFDKYGQQQRRGLERYPSAVARIEALWKSPRILSILQESIFRRPEAGDAECFDLEAYRELLLLFSIAKEVSGMPAGVTSTGHKPKTSYLDSQSVGHEGDAAQSESPLPAEPKRQSRSYRPFENSVSVNSSGDSEIPVPKPSPRLALDVNLFELESVFPEMEANSIAPRLEPSHLPSEDQTLNEINGKVVSTMNAGLNESAAPEVSLPPLDFSLSLPAEFSTAAPAPAMSPKVSPTSLTSSLALDLNKYMVQKDLKAPQDKT